MLPIMSLSVVCFSSPSLVFLADGTYVMSEEETLTIAKERALTQAMRSVSEQAGVYLESISEIKQMQLTHDDVILVAASVIKVIEKQFDPPEPVEGGIKITCHIKAKVEPASVETLKNQALAQQAINELRQLQVEYDRAKQEIERLKIEANKPRQDLTKMDNQALSNHFFKVGYLADQKGDIDGALRAYDIAIDLDNNNLKAHYNRANIYAQSPSGFGAAAVDYMFVISRDEEFLLAYLGRGNLYLTHNFYENALADYEKFCELYEQGKADRFKGKTNNNIDDVYRQVKETIMQIKTFLQKEREFFKQNNL